MTSAETRVCQNCKQPFVIEPDDFAFYEKIGVPAPTWCPRCRLQRRFCFLNERALYKRTCALCGKSMISMHAPDKELTVYCNPCWWSDKWDATQYARDYDPSQPFLAQVEGLFRRTPTMALESNYPTLVNSEYVNYAATAKNCYLIYIADECENVLYSELVLHNKDSMDGTMYGNCELCYEIVNCGKCYRTFFSEDCENCHDVYFSKDCNGCSNCFGCIGLRNKQYHVFNEPLAKEEYEKRLESFAVDSYRGVTACREKSREFWTKYPHKFAHALRNARVTGDYVYESKNAKNMYVVHSGAENCRYCQLITMPPIRDAYDYTTWGNNAQRVYETLATGEGADTIKFCYEVWPNVRNVEYSMFVISSSNMFGCANVRNQEYCILNKKYPKEEYERLRARIIADMNAHPYVDGKGREYRYGEFFPAELSPFGYNESYAMNYFPLDRDGVERDGFRWYEAHENMHEPTIEAETIPERISDVPDSICGEIVRCLDCKKPFRIVPAELELLRRFGLPVPRQCQNCRYQARLARVNPPWLFHRTCQCAGTKSKNGVYANTGTHFHKDGPCPNEFETSYSPERKEIVYCEQCYNGEIV